MIFTKGQSRSQSFSFLRHHHHHHHLKERKSPDGTFIVSPTILECNVLGWLPVSDKRGSLTGTIMRGAELWRWKAKLMSNKTVNHVTEFKGNCRYSQLPSGLVTMRERVTMALIQRATAALLPRNSLCGPPSAYVKLWGVYAAYE